MYEKLKVKELMNGWFHRILTMAYLVVCLLFVSVPPTRAQFQPPQRKAETVDTMDVAHRLALRTNAVDWLLTVPNATVEFDLGRTSYNHFTLSVGGRLNWDTRPDLKTYNVFDVAEARVEVRNYWHTRSRNGGYNNVFQHFFSRERRDPRYWRAYYIGVYGTIDKFALKFSRHGYAGDARQVGISMGMQQALYAYGRSCVDLDLGFSAGALYMDADQFVLDRQANTYRATDHQTRWMPMLNELRIALVYRLKPSAQKRYRFNHQRYMQRMERRAERKKTLP